VCQESREVYQWQLLRDLEDGLAELELSEPCSLQKLKVMATPVTTPTTTTTKFWPSRLALLKRQLLVMHSMVSPSTQTRNTNTRAVMKKLGTLSRTHGMPTPIQVEPTLSMNATVKHSLTARTVTTSPSHSRTSLVATQELPKSNRVWLHNRCQQ
jgi:hypothetical protein